MSLSLLAVLCVESFWPQKGGQGIRRRLKMSSVGRRWRRTAPAARRATLRSLRPSLLSCPSPPGLASPSLHSQPHCSAPNNNSPDAPPSWLREEAASPATTLQLTMQLSSWPPSPSIPFPVHPPSHPHICFSFCPSNDNSAGLKLYTFLDETFVSAGSWFLHLQRASVGSGLLCARPCESLEKDHRMTRGQTPGQGASGRGRNPTS